MTGYPENKPALKSLRTFTGNSKLLFEKRSYATSELLTAWGIDYIKRTEIGVARVMIDDHYLPS